MNVCMLCVLAGSYTTRTFSSTHVSVTFLSSLVRITFSFALSLARWASVKYNTYLLSFLLFHLVSSSALCYLRQFCLVISGYHLISASYRTVYRLEFSALQETEGKNERTEKGERPASLLSLQSSPLPPASHHYPNHQHSTPH